MLREVLLDENKKLLPLNSVQQIKQQQREQAVANPEVEETVSPVTVAVLTSIQTNKPKLSSNKPAPNYISGDKCFTSNQDETED